MRHIITAVTLVLFVATCSIATAAITQTMDSAAFDYCYEFNAPANLGPDGLNLDAASGNTTMDMHVYGPAIPIANGVATLSTARSDDNFYISNEAEEIWRAVGFDDENGFTVEFSVKVTSVASGAIAATSLYLSPADVGTANANDTDGWLQISNYGQNWTAVGDIISLGDDDNTDGFHAFRVALDPASQTYTVWRDGDLLASGLGDRNGGDDLNRIILGDASGYDGGVVEFDYLRLQQGAYAPVPEPSVIILMASMALAFTAMMRRRR